MTDEPKLTKTHNDFFTFIKDKIVFSFIATVFSGFSLFYLFGAALLWRYLKEQGLTGEFSLLLASNNLLMFFAFIGVLMGILLSFYFLYISSLLKTINKESLTLKTKSKKVLFLTHCIGLFLPAPIILFIKWASGDHFDVVFPSIIIVLLLILSYLFWKTNRELNSKKEFREKGVSLSGYLVLIAFITLINFMPLLIIISTINSIDRGSDLLSFMLLGIIFAVYVLIIVILSLAKPRVYTITVVLLYIILMSFILVYSEVPNNAAKHVGIGNYCTDITLKKDATIIQTLRDKSFLDPDPSLTLSNVYVLLHKHKDEYIIAKNKEEKNVKPQRIPYANIEYSGFVNSCTDTD